YLQQCYLLTLITDLWPGLPHPLKRQRYTVCVRWAVFPQQLEDAFCVEDLSMVSELEKLSEFFKYTFADILDVVRDTAPPREQWPPRTTTKSTLADVQLARKALEAKLLQNTGLPKRNFNIGEESGKSSVASFGASPAGSSRSEPYCYPKHREFDLGDISAHRTEGRNSRDGVDYGDGNGNEGELTRMENEFGNLSWSPAQL
ncbi:hypothetical protein B0T22DRAFT_504262, partial [Podospora appendiculata]